MIRCFVALGSNLRSPERQIRQAIKALGGMPKTTIKSVAPFYKNPAVGRKAQPLFCNTVVCLHTTLQPLSLLKECQKIEYRHGRVRRVKNGARTIDIDILLYGERKITLADLTLPHPRMWERDFVMVPLQGLLKT